MKSIILTSITLLLLSFTASIEWTTLSDKNYKIKYPKDWEVNQTGLLGSSFFIFSPRVSETDKFRENVNLMIQDLGENKISLKQYLDISLKQIQTLLTDAKIITSKSGEADGKQYHDIVYEAKQGILDLRFKQRIWVKNNKAIVLTFTIEKEAREQYEEIGNEIIESFSF